MRVTISQTLFLGAKTLLNNRRREAAISFDGQKSGLPVEAYGFKSAQNVTGFVLKEGQLKRVNGGEVYAEVIPGEEGGITSLHRFKNLWVAQRGSTIAVESAEASASFTNIFTDLTSDKFYSAQWRDRIFFVNKTDQKFLYNLENNALSENRKSGDLGIAFIIPESSIGSFIIPYVPGFLSVAGNVPDGIYAYVFTLVDAITNSESPGVGSLQADDGFFGLSPSGDNGPGVSIVTVSGGPYQVIFPASVVTPILRLWKEQCPRATHFVVYRATVTVVSGANIYGTFNRLTASGYLELDKYIDEELDIIDNFATTSSVSLLESNYPPPSVQAAEATFNVYKEGRFWSSFLEDPSEDFPRSQTSGFRHIKTFRDQLFAIGDRCAGLQISDLGAVLLDTVPGVVFNYDSVLRGSEVFQPDYWPYIWEVGRGDGQKAIGLGVLGDTALLIFKEKSTYYLSGSSPSDFIVRIIDTNKGCINESTIQETPNGVICLDRTGFVLFNKIGQGERISTDIQDIIDSILFPYSSTFYSFYDPKEQRYYCSVVVPGGTTPNLTLILDLVSMQWTTDTSIVGLSRLADTDSDGEYVELVGNKQTGRLVSLSNEEISTFQGQAVYSSWTSGVLSFGDDQHKKKMRWLYLKVKASGDWSITVEVIPDFKESQKYTISVNYDAEQETWYSSSASTDGSLIWDEGEWASGGVDQSQVKIPIVCKGRLFQVRIINQDTAANRWGFTLEGISAEAVMLAK